MDNCDAFGMLDRGSYVFSSYFSHGAADILKVTGLGLLLQGKAVGLAALTVGVLTDVIAFSTDPVEEKDKTEYSRAKARAYRRMLGPLIDRCEAYERCLRRSSND